jgi:hypothetical protein
MAQIPNPEPRTPNVTPNRTVAQIPNPARIPDPEPGP